MKPSTTIAYGAAGAGLATIAAVMILMGDVASDTTAFTVAVFIFASVALGACLALLVHVHDRGEPDAPEEPEHPDTR